MMVRFGRALLAAVALAAATPASAIVGGAEDGGALARGTVMVLSSRGGVCSAVVIAPDVLATAAHCVTDAPEHRAHFRDAAGGPVLIELAAKSVHPGFDAKAVARRRQSVDLALVRLASPLPDGFSPPPLTAAAPKLGETLRAGGYGLSVEGDQSGRSTGTFRTADLGVVEPYGPSRILVWLKPADGRVSGACHGDSGGPLTAAGAVLALSTWTTGPKGRSCGMLTQGILLGPQKDWIDRTLTGWNRRARWN